MLARFGNKRSALVKLLGVGLAALAAFAGATRAVAVAAEAASAPDGSLASFSAVEWLEIDWRRTLVTYRVLGPDAVDAAIETDPDIAEAVRLERPAKPGEIRLVDANGLEAPSQFSRVKLDAGGNLESAWLSFFAELPAKGRYDYFLVPGAPTLPSEVTVAMEPGVSGDPLTTSTIVLDNGLTAVRTIDARSGFSGSVRMRPAAIIDAEPQTGLPVGPVQGVRLLTGAWTAPSFFMADDPETAPKITRISGEILADGPLFAEARVRYEFDDGRHYAAVVRLVAGEPLVRIDEQMDMQAVRGERDWRVVFPLTDAEGTFRPDVAWWATPEGRLYSADDEFEQDAVDAGFPALVGNQHGHRRHLASKTFKATGGREVLMPFAVWYPYHAIAYYAGLTTAQAVRDAAEAARAAGENDGESAARRARIPFVGIVPMHAGNWRGIPEPTNGDLVGWADGRVAVSWPLTVGPHPNTLLHTGEYDPDEPYTAIRRQWAFVAGPMQYQDGLGSFRRYEGYVNLDRYKDWILEWPEDEAISYPRLVTSPEHVEQVRERLDEHPAAEELGKLLSFNDDPEKAVALFRGLSSDSYWYAPRGHAIRTLGRDNDSMRSTGWTSGFRHAQKAAWANGADELFSSRHLTPEQRTGLRAWVAAACYGMSEPDFNPRGSMVHLGNPNMPMNRFAGLPFAAALIPDHPRAKRWMEVSNDYLRYKFAMNTAPGGAWSELLSYYQPGSGHLVQAAMVLDNQGMLDDSLASLIAQTALFPMALISPPDPRFADVRTTPNWGHESYQAIATNWLPTASIMRRRDPALARLLVRAWDELGRPADIHHDASFSPRAAIHADLLAEPFDPEGYAEQIDGQWLPGMGATMRAHAGDPLETWLSFRKGYMVSHCDANQGDFVLYSKGGPLTTMSIFMYAIYDNRPFAKLYESFGWHNRVRFGSRENTGGWPGGGAVTQVHRFAGSPSADYLRGLGDYAPQQWQRQFLFLKGKNAAAPNYFVMRDSFRPLADDAMEAKWWYLRSGGPTGNVTRRDDGLTVATPFGASLDVKFLHPAAIPSESREATQSGPLYSQAAVQWKKAGNPIEGSNVEETITVTAAGPVPPGEDILVALYPRAAGEAAPTYETLGRGAVKIVTSEATDYVFLSVEPMQYANDLFSFSGRAGAVRVYPDEVHLVVNEGPGAIEYFGENRAAGAAPLARLEAGAEGRFLLFRGGQSTEQELDRGLRGYVDQVASSTAAAAPFRAEELPDAPPIPADPRDFLANRPGAKLAVDSNTGVIAGTFDGGFGWAFDSPAPLDFRLDRIAEIPDMIAFRGKRGAIAVDTEKDEVSFLLLEAESAAAGSAVVLADADGGPVAITYQGDRVIGRFAGIARMLYASRPERLDTLPMFVVDGQTYAPGSVGDLIPRHISRTGDPYTAENLRNAMILPLLPGEHVFSVEALKQPPVFRAWQHRPEP